VPLTQPAAYSSPISLEYICSQSCHGPPVQLTYLGLPRIARPRNWSCDGVHAATCKAHEGACMLALHLFRVGGAKGVTKGRGEAEAEEEAAAEEAAEEED